MRRFLLSVLFAAALGVAWADDEDPEPPAKGGTLAGEWELTEIKAKGMAIPLPPEFKMKFAFSRNGSAEVTAPGQQAKTGKWKADLSKKPAELDLTGDGITSKMIIKLDKGLLSIGGVDGMGGNNGPRPKGFDDTTMIMVFKRAAKNPK